jgi:hypothetical protein
LGEGEKGEQERHGDEHIPESGMSDERLASKSAPRRGEGSDDEEACQKDRSAQSGQEDAPDLTERGLS